MKEFERLAAARLQVLQREQEALVRTHAERVSVATRAVDASTESVASLAEHAKLKGVQQRRSEARLADVVRQLTDAPVSDRGLLEETARLKELEAALEKRRADGAASTLPGDLAEVNKEIDSLKRLLSTMRRERDDLSAMASTAGQVALLQRDGQDKEEAAEKLFGACRQRVLDLFGEEARL